MHRHTHKWVMDRLFSIKIHPNGLMEWCCFFFVEAFSFSLIDFYFYFSFCYFIFRFGNRINFSHRFVFLRAISFYLISSSFKNISLKWLGEVKKNKMRVKLLKAVRFGTRKRKWNMILLRYFLLFIWHLIIKWIGCTLAKEYSGIDCSRLVIHILFFYIYPGIYFIIIIRQILFFKPEKTFDLILYLWERISFFSFLDFSKIESQSKTIKTDAMTTEWCLLNLVLGSTLKNGTSFNSIWNNFNFSSEKAKCIPLCGNRIEEIRFRKKGEGNFLIFTNCFS